MLLESTLLTRWSPEAGRRLFALLIVNEGYEYKNAGAAQG